MKKKVRLLISIFLCSILLLEGSGTAMGANVSECRIAASSNSMVSLGFPLASERLGNKKSVNVLVVPFRLVDVPSYTFTTFFKDDYLQAARIIENLSDGQVKVNIIFSEVIDVNYTSNDMVTLLINQQESWRTRDESRSTWGFVRKLVAEIDTRLNFRGVDTVFLHGSSAARGSHIAEAMMFSPNPTDQWFRPISTAEGDLYNAILVDKHQNVYTIAHELLHNFGLTDLYGSANSPEKLSLMASNSLSLLSYEKWVLGWVPDSRVQCIVESRDIDQTKVSTRINLPNNGLDQILVVRTPEEKTALVIEISKRYRTEGTGAERYLAFYSLHNDFRPPIKLFTPKNIVERDGVNYLREDKINPDAIGSRLESERYDLLITDVTASNIVLDLIPHSQLPNASALFAAVEITKARAVEYEKSSRDRADAEAKAKAEAEAKSKAAAEASSQIESSKKVKKGITITCFKGTKVKTVSGTKPQCPRGYKKK